jgi:hypothetical protein
MNFRSFLVLMSLATAGAWIAWTLVLHGVDPTQAGFLGFLLFYGALSISLFGTFSVLGVLVRLWRYKDTIAQRVTVDASRQAFLFTCLCLVSLCLFSQGWFRWWTMLLCVLIVGLLELITQSRRHGH